MKRREALKTVLAGAAALTAAPVLGASEDFHARDFAVGCKQNALEEIRLWAEQNGLRFGHYTTFPKPNNNASQLVAVWSKHTDYLLVCSMAFDTNWPEEFAKLEDRFEKACRYARNMFWQARLAGYTGVRIDVGADLVANARFFSVAAAQYMGANAW